MHACDARVKIVLLLAYSATVFLVETWAGLGLCALAFTAALAASRIAPGRVFGLMWPVYAVMLLTVAFNGFAFDVAAAAGRPMGLGAVSVGIFEDAPPVPFIGSFGIVPAGMARGVFFAGRILLLVAASLVASLTTSSTALADAFARFLRPLRVLRVPVDDVAMVLSIALRFIPVIAEELGRIHDAQWARGATFGTGSLAVRLRAWGTVLMPLFASLFRRAEALTAAMDARCYGAPGVARTALVRARMTSGDAASLIVGLAACAAVAVLL